MEILSKSTRSRIRECRQSFSAARPFRHVVIDNFFVQEFAERLLDKFPAVDDPASLLNEFGVPNPKSCISDLKSLGGIYEEFDRYIQNPDFLRYVEDVTGVSNLRYDPYYFGAGTHENFHGAGLDAHYDFNIHPVTGQHRRLNAIVYLNKDWNPEWGGTLRLHSDAWDLVNDEQIDIDPSFNRMAIFETTESSWHSVPTIDQPPPLRDRSRKSVTIYLYTDERPAAEQAPPHGTVYVQSGLPRHIRAGRTLDEFDVKEITDNISRRQSYLREMYKREYKYSDVIEKFRHQVVELERCVHIPLQGYVRVSRVVSACYSDGWIGERFHIEVVPTRPITGVKLHGYRHDGSAPMRCTLSLGEQMFSTVIDGGVLLIELRSTQPISEAVKVEFVPEKPQQASKHDLRAVSVLMTALEFLHE